MSDSHPCVNADAIFAEDDLPQPSVLLLNAAQVSRAIGMGLVEVGEDGSLQLNEEGNAGP